MYSTSSTSNMVSVTSSFLGNDLDDDSCFDQQVTMRIVNLAMIPFSVLATVGDTIIGLGHYFNAVLMIGRKSGYENLAHNHLSALSRIISNIFEGIIQTINPNAEFGDSDFPGATYFCVTTTLTQIFEASETDSFLKRHVVSRIGHTLTLGAAVITHAVDGVIGAIAAVFAIVTLGKYKNLNDTAYKGLQVTGVVSDLLMFPLRILKPY